MAVRREHNRVKESPSGHDLQEVLTKAKRYYKGWGEFYIFAMGGYYCTSGINSKNKTAVTKYTNAAPLNQRAQWTAESLR